jgi:predicted HicB family RNase H-like nuclease
MKKLVRIEIRVRPELKERLAAEASLCNMSLNTYLVATITYRRRVKNVVLTDEGHYGLN